MKRFDKLLKELKAEEFDGTALLILDDAMVQMIAAWPKVHRTYSMEPVEDDRMPEAWWHVGFYMSQWASLANVSEAVCWKLWLVLVTHRLIYPDGTVPSKVGEYMLTQVGITLGTGGSKYG